MVAYTAAFLVAAFLSLVTTPLLRLVALRLGAVSAVGGRNVNRAVIPRLGGIAIALSVIVPLLLLFVVRSEVARLVREQELRVVGLGFGMIVMCVIGAWDDVRGMSAWNKFFFQLLCALVAYLSGFRIPSITVPGLGILEMGEFALPLTMLWIVGVTNAVNLIDGLDGLAAGVVFCAAATNLIVATIGGTVLVAVVMAALMGALFGFLFYNFNPARIFMGDSGSYFAGYTLATVSLAGHQKASTAVALLVPVLALGLPIFDTLFSIVRRALERRPLFSPDRGHIHHKLLDWGLTHRRAVLSLYGVSVLFSVSALVISLERDWTTGAAILMAVVLSLGLIRMNLRVSAHVLTVRNELRDPRTGMRDNVGEGTGRAREDLEREVVPLVEPSTHHGVEWEGPPPIETEVFRDIDAPKEVQTAPPKVETDTVPEESR